MNRNVKFFLIMAIFYTVISGLVIFIVFSMGSLSLVTILLVLLAGLCAGSQWLRFRRARDEAKGIVREKKVPKFVPMPEKTEVKADADGEDKHESD